MRIIFMGTPEFALPALQQLIGSEHKIAAVYTAPPKPAMRGQKLTKTPVHKLAEEHHLPVYTPANLKTMESQQQFAAHRADVAIVVAYGLLLPPAILNACPLGCINIHPSSLPRWRGAAPIQRTIMAGDKRTSVCIMQMDEGLDTGAVLMEEHIDIANGTTAGDLHNQLAALSAPLLLQTLIGLEQRTILAMPQSLDGVTYASKISKEEAKLDFTMPAIQLLHQIHGLSPYPGAYFIYHGERIKLLKAEKISSGNHQLPATIVDDALTIQTGEDAIRPVIIQREGKKPMSLAECLRGWNIPAGTSLSS